MSYSRTPAGRACKARYRKTVGGRANKARWNRSPKGRAAKMRSYYRRQVIGGTFLVHQGAN